jgi:hypothetical protein
MWSLTRDKWHRAEKIRVNLLRSCHRNELDDMNSRKAV